jgi:amino acid transporter
MELSSMYPRAGAEYEFVKRAFGERMGLFAGLLVVYFVTITSSAVAIGFGKYFSKLFEFGSSCGVIGLFLFLCPVMVYGIRESARLAVFISLIELSGLLLIIYAGLPHIGEVNYFELRTLQGCFKLLP